MRFLDFDLLFQRTASGYRAQVLNSPAGQASNEFALPFSDLEIDNFLLRLGRARQTTRRLAATQIEAARAFGGRLFEAAFDREVQSCLERSLDAAAHQDAGLRVRLRLKDAPELNDLPWEFLLNPALDRFLALSAETPIVRYLDLPERIRPLEVKPPLELLAVISSPTDYPELDVEKEWSQLRESLKDLEARRLLRLRRLGSSRLGDLQRWLRRETCHVLHFMGHGGFSSDTEDGLLLFTDENGRGREVTGQTLATVLHDHRELRLAVLNACEGARASRSDPFAGVAQCVVREGIPAVIAMQFEISDSAAIGLAHELYAAVADGYPVDAALAEARKALFIAGHELEWGTPVLYMRSPDGKIFDVEPVAATDAVTSAPTPTEAVLPTPGSAPVEAKPGSPGIKPFSGAKLRVAAAALGLAVLLGVVAWYLGRPDLPPFPVPGEGAGVSAVDPICQQIIQGSLDDIDEVSPADLMLALDPSDPFRMNYDFAEGEPLFARIERLCQGISASDNVLIAYARHLAILVGRGRPANTLPTAAEFDRIAQDLNASAAAAASALGADRGRGPDGHALLSARAVQLLESYIETGERPALSEAMADTQPRVDEFSSAGQGAIRILRSLVDSDYAEQYYSLATAVPPDNAAILKLNRTTQATKRTLESLSKTYAAISAAHRDLSQATARSTPSVALGDEALRFQALVNRLRTATAPPREN